MKIASIFLSFIHGVEGIHYPFGVYGGSVGKAVHMESFIKSATLADVDILIKIPKSKNPSIEGWALFHLEMAEIRVEEGRIGTSLVTFLPRGVDSHPVAREMRDLLQGLVNVEFPMTGVYNAAKKTITYEFGPFDLELEGFGSGRLMDPVKTGEKVTTYKTPDSFKFPPM